MKTLAELKSACVALGLTVAENRGRASKEPYLHALRDHHWRQDHPDQSLPAQISPMLLGDWDDLNPAEARRIERDEPGWIVQPKLDGVRALLQVEGDRVRITSRCISEVTYRLGEFQDNLPHLKTGFSDLDGTILDGELVFPSTTLDTGQTIARHPLQAAMAIVSTSPDQARKLQSQPENRVRFHAFDILKYRDTDLTRLLLRDRLDFLARAIAVANHPYLNPVPSNAIGKLDIHRRILEAGGEGTVWKQLDQPYESDRRVGHWLKRKREITLEAFVTGFKPGTPGHGHENLIGSRPFRHPEFRRDHPDYRSGNRLERFSKEGDDRDRSVRNPESESCLPRTPCLDHRARQVGQVRPTSPRPAFSLA